MLQDYQKLHSIIAKNCRRLRKQRQMTQAQLGEKAGIDLSTIKNIEREKTDYLPKLETVYILADALGVPGPELLTPKDEASYARSVGDTRSELNRAKEMCKEASAIIERICEQPK